MVPPGAPRCLRFVGVGDAPDAATYGDLRTDTSATDPQAVGGRRAPNLKSLGLGNLTPSSRERRLAPTSGIGHGRATEVSAGKDTTTGHWEMTGVRLDRPFPLYPKGFPPEIIEAFGTQIGREDPRERSRLGHRRHHRRAGEEHMRTGKRIVYTSGDSVPQTATHKDVVRSRRSTSGAGSRAGC